MLMPLFKLTHDNKLDIRAEIHQALHLPSQLCYFYTITRLFRPANRCCATCLLKKYAFCFLHQNDANDEKICQFSFLFNKMMQKKGTNWWELEKHILGRKGLCSSCSLVKINHTWVTTTSHVLFWHFYPCLFTLFFCFAQITKRPAPFMTGVATIPKRQNVKSTTNRSSKHSTTF